MATAEQLFRSIEPGSVPYGERQTLEAGLSDLAASPAPAGPTGIPEAPPPEDEALTPEQILEEGSVSDLPITSGLSLGPGPGPFMGVEATTEQRRLQEIALNAPSALIRYTAALALRRIYERQKRGL